MSSFHRMNQTIVRSRKHLHNLGGCRKWTLEAHIQCSKWRKHKRSQSHRVIIQNVFFFVFGGNIFHMLFVAE